MATVEVFTREQGLQTFGPQDRPGAAPAQPDPISPDPAAPAPEVPEQPAAAGESAPTGPDESSPESDETVEAALTQDEGTKRQRPFVTRILRENGALQQRIQALEAQLAIALQQTQRDAAPATTPATPSSTQPQALVPPRQEDYADNPQGYAQAAERYWRAMAAEEAQRILQDHAQQQAERELQRLDAQVGLKIRQGLAQYDDMQTALAYLDAYLDAEVRDGPLKIVVARSPQGIALLRHLGTHPELVEDLNDRKAEAALRYLTKLETELAQPLPPSTPPARPTPPPPPAPPPVRPLNPGPGARVLPAVTSQDIAAQNGGLLAYQRARQEEYRQAGHRR